jgi:NB-ARC domain
VVIANPIFHGGLNVDPQPFPRPAQLPKRSTRLVGRAEELAWLDEATGEGEHVEGGLAVVSGPAGAGKTALAQHWGHRVGSSFPDGQLWLDLGGDEAQRRMTPQAAIQHMLYALGIPPRQLLGDEQELTALFRTTLSDRRVLIILDNAASSAQVRPLLPSGPSVVLVTSRRRLDGLVADSGAQLLELGMLDDGAAISLLGETIGVQLHPSEREAADEIVHHCGYLPLAIKVAGARLRARRHYSGALASLADRLREERHRLDLLHAEDIGVRTSLAISYEALSANTARAFRLLGLFPGPKLQRYAAATMLKTSVEDAERSLEALAELSADVWKFVGGDHAVAPRCWCSSGRWSSLARSVRVKRQPNGVAVCW